MSLTKKLLANLQWLASNKMNELTIEYKDGKSIIEELDKLKAMKQVGDTSAAYIRELRSRLDTDIENSHTKDVWLTAVAVAQDENLK